MNSMLLKNIRSYSIFSNLLVKNNLNNKYYYYQIKNNYIRYNIPNILSMNYNTETNSNLDHIHKPKVIFVLGGKF